MTSTRRTDDVRPRGSSRHGTRALEVAENLIYGGIAVFLVLSGFVLLAVAAKTSLGLMDDFSQQPLLEVLDVLLLVFIVVELLFAVRTTVERRELVAEPFSWSGSSRRSRRSWSCRWRQQAHWARVRSSTTVSWRSGCSADSSSSSA